MNKAKLQKFNKPWIGLVAGLMFPLISFYIYYLVKSTNTSFTEFLDVLKYGKAFIPILSLCVLPNLILFFICKQLNLWYTIKGIVFSIFLYLMLVLVLKFA